MTSPIYPSQKCPCDRMGVGLSFIIIDKDMAGEVMAVSLTTVWRNVVQCRRMFGDRVHPNMGIQDAHPYVHENW